MFLQTYKKMCGKVVHVKCEPYLYLQLFFLFSNGMYTFYFHVRELMYWLVTICPLYEAELTAEIFAAHSMGY
jgi:hypothetical protein